jgi:hypothetical protein
LQQVLGGYVAIEVVERHVRGVRIAAEEGAAELLSALPETYQPSGQHRAVPPMVQAEAFEGVHAGALTGMAQVVHHRIAFKSSKTLAVIGEQEKFSESFSRRRR